MIQAIELDLLRVEFYQQSGQAYRQMGQTEQALDDFEQALALRPPVQD